jgi:hypothetical protein
MIDSSYMLESVGPKLDGGPGTRAQLARDGYVRPKLSTDTNTSVSSEFPGLSIEGSGTSSSLATATDAGVNSAPQATAATTIDTTAGATALTGDGFATAVTSAEVGLANTSGVMSAADIIAAFTPKALSVSGNPSDLSVSNPAGAPEISAPSNAQLEGVASATAAVTTNTGEQGTGTIVNYNGKDYMITDGHVTGTNPNGIADGTNTPAATQVNATTPDGTALSLGPVIADPSNDVAIYPITGANGQYNSLPLANESGLTDGQTVYSVNYGDGQLQAASGTFLGVMPNIYFFPGGITPDTGREVGNTTMSADPGSSGGPIVTMDQNGQFSANGVIYSGDGNYTQFTGASAIKNDIDGAQTAAKLSTPPPDITTPAPEPTVTTPEPTATAPEPTVTAPEPTVTAPEPTATAPEPTATAPEPTVTAPEPTATITDTTSAQPVNTIADTSTISASAFDTAMDYGGGFDFEEEFDSMDV